MDIQKICQSVGFYFIHLNHQNSQSSKLSKLSRKIKNLKKIPVLNFLSTPSEPYIVSSPQKWFDTFKISTRWNNFAKKKTKYWCKTMDLERNIRVKNRKKNVCNLWLLISCHDQNNCRKIKISKQTEHKIQVEKKKILKNELSTFRSFLLLFHKHTHTKIDGKFKRQKEIYAEARNANY